MKTPDDLLGKLVRILPGLPYEGFRFTVTEVFAGEFHGHYVFGKASDGRTYGPFSAADLDLVGRLDPRDAELPSFPGVRL